MSCRALKNGIAILSNGTIAPCYLYDTASRLSSDDTTIKEYRENVLIPLYEEMKSSGEFPKPCWKCQYTPEQGINQINSHLNELDPGNNSDDLLMIDISLSNVCNNACIMCSPGRSTMYKKHQDKGLFLFPGQDGYLKKVKDNYIENVSDNVYKELIESSKNLKHIYIKGGEPTFDPKVLKLLNEFDNPSEIIIQLNTNLTNVTTEFLEKVFQFKSAIISFSIDAYGELNDALRYPSKWNTVIRNMETWLKHRRPDDVFDVSSVISIYNFFNYPKLSKLIHEEFAIRPTINILQTPVYHDICRLPEKYFKDGVEEYYPQHQSRLVSYWDKKKLSQPDLKINDHCFIDLSNKWFNSRGYDIKITENPFFL